MFMKYPIDNPNINLVYLNGVMAGLQSAAEIKDPVEALETPAAKNNLSPLITKRLP